MQNYISMLKLYGVKVGVAAQRNYWKQFFGNEYGCQQVSNNLLAWVPTSD